MNETEFIDFMQELVLAPDSVIKKAHMKRMLTICSGLQMYKLATQNEESARARRIKELEEALVSIRATAREVIEAKDSNLNIDPEWVVGKIQAALKEGV